MVSKKLLPWLAALAVLVVVVVVFVAIPALRSEKAPPPDYWPTEGWQTSTPEEQGFDSSKLAEGLLAMRLKDIYIHSLFIVRNGRVFLDATFYPYDGQVPHEMASVTKSMMTTLIGIAAGQGKLDLDDPMLKYFPGREIANLDAHKEKITIRHLASMSSGLDCTNEMDEQTLREMKVTENWSQFALDRKVEWEPGSQFVYCSPAIHLLSPILQQATSTTALEFGREYLFEPLGIQEVLWQVDPQGYSRGSEGIHLLARDAAKLGFLWLHGGSWEGQQIVPPTWVKGAVSVQMDLPGDDEDDYGYGWWLSPGDPSSYNMIGRGGQRVLVVPAWNLVIATNGGGFEFDDIEPFLVAAIGDMEKALPANPEGVARLAAAVEQVRLPPEPHAVSPLPELAREIADNTYVFDPNPSSIETINLVFDGSNQAVMNIKLFGKEPESWPVGLDGLYRWSTGDYGLPLGARGEWISEDTFLFEYDNIANNDHVFFNTRFEADRIIMEAQETSHEGGASIEGRLLSP